MTNHVNKIVFITRVEGDELEKAKVQFALL